MKILIVDDEPSILELLHCALEQKGYQVMVADNPRTALELCEKSSGVDLLITDTRMGIADAGLHLVESVRSRWPKTRFVLMSGEPRNAAKAQEQGIGFLPKPFELEKVLL